MGRRADRILLVFIIALTAFSLVVMWPSEPWRYLPEAIPWPEGQGIKIPFFKFDGPAIEGSTLERRAMRLGLDLRGGTRVLLEADPTGLEDINLDEALDTNKDIIERRINEFGVAESEIRRTGSDRLDVQVPGLTAEEVKSKIAVTALLRFCAPIIDENGNVAVVNGGKVITNPFSCDPARDAAGNILTDPGASVDYVPISAANPETIVWTAGRGQLDGVDTELTGRFLKPKNIVVASDAAGAPELRLEFNSEGGKLMESISAPLVGFPLTFFLDATPQRGVDGHIIAPIVQTTLADQIRITGLSAGDAFTLQKLLRSGSFPLPMKVIQEEDVDATLGEDSVQKSVIAGEVAMLIIGVFMVLHYRLPGVLAALALFVYTSVVLAVFKLWPITLTLAGIAAFVLSVGMAVDANILIFERMKEELRIGRSLVVALDEGFSRAWSSIRDSNVSTLITCVILFWFGDQFGASLVKGFALTLAIGVLISMFSAILVTRTFLKLAISLPALRRAGLWAPGLPPRANMERDREPEPVEVISGGGR